MSVERMVVNDSDTERDQSGYRDLYRGLPFTGLIVALSPSGEITWLAETLDGWTHGYSVDCVNGLPTDVDEYQHGTLHGLHATWEAGQLMSLSRCQYGVVDQRLRPDGRIEELPEATAKIARIQARWQTPAPEPLTLSLHDLLARFRDTWSPLLLEARRGLGLA